MNTLVPTIGRLVLVTTTDRNGNPVVRPGVITNVFSNDLVNVQVHIDGTNDDPSFNGGGTRWAPSITYDEDPGRLGTWRWMPVQAAGGGFDARITALDSQRESHAQVLTQLGEQVNELEARLLALNAKQPATQRLPDTEAQNLG